MSRAGVQQLAGATSDSKYSQRPPCSHLRFRGQRTGLCSPELEGNGLMHTIIEPFRIKMTEALPITTRDQREAWLASAHNNVFLLNAEDITIDLLTDSGTGAMSARQWAAMMLGDESYAGSTSWHRFENTVREITGFKHIFPVHQGRAAERILAVTRLKSGDVVPNNSHFDTTRANIEYAGAQAVDLLTPEGQDIYSETWFKGNMD